MPWPAWFVSILYFHFRFIACWSLLVLALITLYILVTPVLARPTDAVPFCPYSHHLGRPPVTWPSKAPRGTPSSAQQLAVRPKHHPVAANRRQPLRHRGSGETRRCEQPSSSSRESEQQRGPRQGRRSDGPEEPRQPFTCAGALNSFEALLHQDQSQPISQAVPFENPQPQPVTQAVPFIPAEPFQ